MCRTINIILFLTISACSSYGQFDVGDVCTTENGEPGTCKYEETCGLLETHRQNREPETCSYDEDKLIVCCPDNNRRRFTRSTENISIQTTSEAVQPPEPEGCPPLPRIQTPSFDNPAQAVAWEKCVANQRFVHTCKHNGQSYTRHNTCAIPNSPTSGQHAAFREFPHWAGLGCDSDTKRRDSGILWIGGGSLISDRYILTAAQMTKNAYGPVRYALLGTLNKTDIRDGDLYGVVRVLPYPLYSYENKLNDIALVLLNRRVIFSELIRPICLPVPGIDPEDSLRLITGWGPYQPHGNLETILKKSTVLEVSSAVCNESLHFPGFVWNDATMICVQGIKTRYGFSGSCAGDGGGPLMYRVANPEFSCDYVAGGIVSWGPMCGKGLPEVHTRVSAYLDWIVRTVWPEELATAIAASN